MRPLEERFPTLYYNIVHERSTQGAVEEKRTEKETAPSLFDVVEAVCSTHRVTDVGLMKDLTSAISEFTVGPDTAIGKLIPPEPAKKEKAKASKESE